MQQRRLLTLVASAAVMFIVWSFFHQSEDDVIQRQHVSGRISEIHEKQSPVGNKPTANRESTMAIAVVDIEGPTTSEDGHARILIRRGQFEVGEEVPLIFKRYKDGSRKVVLAPAQKQDSAQPVKK